MISLGFLIIEIDMNVEICFSIIFLSFSNLSIPLFTTSRSLMKHFECRFIIFTGVTDTTDAY